MQLIILHGYLLQGTGSNIYVVNIAKAWRKQGHAVTVVCQDRTTEALPFVEEFIGPQQPIPPTPPRPGTIRVVTPDINGLLPVYVFDRYDGFEVKTIPDMSKQEIENHIAMTAATLRRVANQGAARVLVNHALLGPVIAKRALQDMDVPYDVKIHGSAVEYTLVPHPRLLTYAYEGLEKAENIFAGTRYVQERVLEVFADVAESLRLKEKLKIVPPGMDPDLFTMTADCVQSQNRLVDKIRTKIQQNSNGRDHRRIPEIKVDPNGDLHQKLIELGETYDQRATDVDLLERWPTLARDEPVILYFGKFLGQKGVGEILLTAPTILSAVPQARFIFIGFGAYREHLEAMLMALGSGDLERFTACARAGEFIEVRDIARWFRRLEADEIRRITVTGIMDHECLSELLPLASLTIVPSKWPEAFGMVAVEAMAAGVLPLCNYHAGLRDVVDEVHIAEPEIANIMKLERAEFVHQLPEKVCQALTFLYPDGFDNPSGRQKVGEALRRIAVEKFSWAGIAKRLLQ